MNNIENDINFLSEYYLKGIDSCFNSFICKDTGGVKHNPSEKTIAYKSTVRTALFFSQNNFSDYQDIINKLNVYAKSILPKKEEELVILKEGRETFDSLITLLYWPTDYKEEIMFAELLKTIEAIEDKQNNIRTPTASDSDFSKQLPPHSINYYYLGKVFRKLLANDLLTDDLSAYWNKIKIRCADEVSKQLGFLKCKEYYSLDIGKLVFSLQEAKEILSESFFNTALELSIGLIVTTPNHNLSPYRIKDRDTVIRPLPEELFNIIFSLLHQHEFEKHHQPIDDKLLSDLIRLFNSDISSRYMTIDRTFSGWTKERGIYRFHPEIFPTISTLEAIKSCKTFLRFHILLELQKKFSFTIQTKLPRSRSFESFNNYPFDLFDTLSKMFVKRNKDSWSSAVLFGPPGTGKTSLVKSISQKLDWTFVNITPSDLAQDGPSQIVNRARILLTSLTKTEKCVILMDEFDTFISNRDKENKDHWQSLITNCMLPLLAELKENKEIIFFIATNYIDEMDPAAIRDGRFDAIIPIWPLSHQERLRLIEHICPTAKKGDIMKKAYNSRGCTYGELINKLKSEDRVDENVFLGIDNGKRWQEQLKFCRPKVEIESFE